MIRGMISGLIWGAVFSAGLGVVLTQVGGRIDVVRAAVPPPGVDAAGGTAPAVDTSAGALGTALGTTPPVGDAPQPGQQPASETPVDGSVDVARPATIAVDGAIAAGPPDSESGVGPVEGQAPTRPSNSQIALPQTGADGLPLRVPDAPVAGGSDEVRTPDTPILPAGQGDAPEAPQIAADGTEIASQAPAAPGAEAGGQGDTAVVGAPPPAAPGTIAAPGDPAAPTAQADLADGVAAAPGTESRPTTPRPAAPGTVATDDLGDDVLAALAPADSPRSSPQRQDRASADEEADIEEGLDPVSDRDQNAGVDVPAEPQTEGARSAARVVVNRLPRIGDTTPGEETTQAALQDPATQQDAASADGSDAQPADGDAAVSENETESSENSDADPAPDAVADGAAPAAPQGSGALYAHSVQFDRAQGQPVMAVVLIDDPNANTNFSALPISVTIAVQSDTVGSVQRAQSHREAGREVVLIPPISSGDSRTDIARRLTEAMGHVPEAVAVMDLPNQPFQSSRFAVGEVIVALASSGHGMIIYAGGLNTAERLGSQQDVATARVFRDIDGRDQDAAAVKLALDQAAFQARQLDSVILIGRNRPDTVQALAEWVDRRLDDSVKLAPVSVALKP